MSKLSAATTSKATVFRGKAIPVNDFCNEGPRRPRLISRGIGLAAKVLLAAGMLGLVAAPRVLGQTSARDSTTQPSAGQAGAQPSANPNLPSAANPGSASTAANQIPPLAVNPLTGLVSASALDFHPLTGDERWQLYWRQNFLSVGAYFGPVFTALALDQATGSPSQWGGGLEGYGRRVGSRTATAMVQGTLQASVAAALHEDVRYISSGQTGFKRRALHAFVFSFVTYNNQGHTTLNIANLFSYYAATAISTTWVPGRGNVATYALTNGTAQIGLSIPINMLQEFWPEIRHNMFRRP